MTDSAEGKDALLPCPFCGGEVHLQELKDGEWRIQCYLRVDHLVSTSRVSRSAAIAAWNTRTASPTPADDAEGEEIASQDYIKGFEAGCVFAMNPAESTVDCCDAAMRERLNVDAVSLNKDLTARVAALTAENKRLAENADPDPDGEHYDRSHWNV